jgi:hypothetical protein
MVVSLPVALLCILAVSGRRDAKRMSFGLKATLRGNGNATCFMKPQIQYLCPNNPLTAMSPPNGKPIVLFAYVADRFSGFFAMITDILNQILWAEEAYGVGNVEPVISYGHRMYASREDCKDNIW